MTPPPPLRMRLVPAEPTEEMHDDEAVAETFQRVWSAEYKRSMALYGTPAFASYSFTKPMWSAMLDAAPSSGRVSREAVERVARASRTAWLQARTGEMMVDATAIWTAVAAAAIAALGLELAPDAATARGGDGEEAGDADPA